MHAHTFYGLAAGLALRRLTGRPLVYTVPSSFQHIRDSGYAWVLAMYARHHRRIDRFVTSYPDELRGIGVPDSKVVLVRGMADVTGMIPLGRQRAVLRARLRAELSLGGDALLAISVGRLAPEKGFTYGLRALPAILLEQPSLHWVIIGDGPERPAIEELAVHLGVRPNVHLVGFVPDPLPWYAAADLYLRTNVLEGDNLSSFQAMAAGLPVAAFDTGSETELVPHAQHGVLVENRNSAALGRAVVDLIEAPDRDQIGRQGAIFAAANLSTEHVVRCCEDAYRELVGPRGEHVVSL